MQFRLKEPTAEQNWFLLFEETNKCNICFPSTIFSSCLVCLETSENCRCFQRLKERFVQIYRDFVSIESSSYRDFANVDEMFWDLKRKLWRKVSGILTGRSRRIFPWNCEELFEAAAKNIWIWSPVGICVFAMEALKKKIFPTLLRHVPLIEETLIRSRFWGRLGYL